MATKLLIEQFVRCHNQNHIKNQGRKLDQLKLVDFLSSLGTQVRP